MSGRVLLLGLSLALAGALLTRGAGPRVKAPPPAPPAAGRASARTPSAPAPHWPARDPFRYREDALSPASPGAAASPVAVAPAPALAREPAAPRLVGLVWQGERLSAALAIDGLVLTVRAGDTVAGHRILSIDEDTGVRLQDPAGEEVLLAPPPSSSPVGEVR